MGGGVPQEGTRKSGTIAIVMLHNGFKQAPALVQVARKLQRKAAPGVQQGLLAWRSKMNTFEQGYGFGGFSCIQVRHGKAHERKAALWPQLLQGIENSRGPVQVSRTSCEKSDFSQQVYLV